MASFSGLTEVPLDESLALHAAFTADTNSRKVTLGQGVYRGDDGKAWLLPCVKEAETQVQNDPESNHEYLPVEGSTEFLRAAASVLFGPSSATSSPISSVQTISGTGACHLGALLLNNHLRPSQIFLPDPTWINHPLIFETIAPTVPRRSYPYFAATGGLNIDGMLSYLDSTAQEGDVVLLHGCGHNPTGVDPSKEDWQSILGLVQRKRLFPFFDVAYQGFASGNLDEDAWPIRHFHKQLIINSMQSRHESDADIRIPLPLGIAVAQSFSKSLGLYGERVGAFHLVLPSKVALAGAHSQLQRLSRAEISSPPSYGSRIAAAVLTDAELRQQWNQDLKTMTDRLRRMRSIFREEIAASASSVFGPAQASSIKEQWSFLESQTGMFAYVPKAVLSEDMIEILRRDYHIYMMKTGRMAISGLNNGNVRYVAESLVAAMRQNGVDSVSPQRITI